jgi:hypothetical protein
MTTTALITSAASPTPAIAIRKGPKIVVPARSIRLADAGAFSAPAIALPKKEQEPSVSVPSKTIVQKKVRPDACKKIEVDSIKAVVGTSKQVMNYGFSACRYEEAGRALRGDESPVQLVFDWNAGDSKCDEPDCTTLEGRNITALEYDQIDGPQADAPRCETALSNLLLENCKRQIEGLPLIPLIFHFDIDGNPYPQNTQPASILSQDPDKPRLITNMEIERLYSQCIDSYEGLSEEQAETARKVARTMTVFVKLQKTAAETYKMVPVKAPWEASDWGKEWAARKVPAASSKSETPPWNKQVVTHLKAFIDDRAKAARATAVESPALVPETAAV